MWYALSPSLRAGAERAAEVLVRACVAEHPASEAGLVAAAAAAAAVAAAAAASAAAVVVVVVVAPPWAQPILGCSPPSAEPLPGCF